MAQTTRYMVAGALVILVVLVLVPFATNASDWSEGSNGSDNIWFPFGGIITFVRPCLGAGLVLATIIQPPPRPPIEVASVASPFLFYKMSHPGQFVLGMLTNPTVCFTSPHTSFTVPFSFFYGTSI